MSSTLNDLTARRRAGTLVWLAASVLDKLRAGGAEFDPVSRSWAAPDMDAILAATGGKIEAEERGGFRGFKVTDGTASERELSQKADLRGIAEELQRRRDSARDFVVDPAKLGVSVEESTGRLCVEVGEHGAFALNNHAFGQLAANIKVPVRYLRRCLQDEPQLAVDQTARWLRDSSPRMIRTLDGRVRAFLSSSYRPLDNFDLLFCAMDQFDRNGVDILDARIGDQHFFLRGIDRSITEIIRPASGYDNFSFRGPHREPDGSLPVVSLGNSETGSGSTYAEFATFVNGCGNLQIATRAVSKVHVGRRQTIGEEVLLTDETKRLRDQLVWAEVRDAISGAFDPIRFKELVRRMDEATKHELSEPVKEVEKVASRFGLSESQSSSLLDKFVGNAEPTQFGLASALTELAQDESVAGSYETRQDWERAGGVLMGLCA